MKVAAQEGQTLPEKLAMKIAGASQRNMRKAIMILQTCKILTSGTLSGKPLTENAYIHIPEYEKYTKDIA
jgi:DNA polymerase III delta prime subunit